uniref:Uncharacterized protein n=1 Tax=Mycena chlorophos TaxID=658473 RepID=A0ABQ0LWQ2_MYCCL|nr:predicted protein [Mycena chlorophos]
MSFFSLPTTIMTPQQLLREEYQHAIQHAQSRISAAEDAVTDADTDNMKYHGHLARAQELLLQSNLRVVRAQKELKDARAEYDTATKNYEDALVALALAAKPSQAEPPITM